LTYHPVAHCGPCCCARGCEPCGMPPLYIYFMCDRFGPWGGPACGHPAVPHGPAIAAVSNGPAVAAVPHGPAKAAVLKGPAVAVVPNSPAKAAVPNGPAVVDAHK
jgi:hypothetical protein